MLSKVIMKHMKLLSNLISAYINVGDYLVKQVKLVKLLLVWNGEETCGTVSLRETCRETHETPATFVVCVHGNTSRCYYL
jgi:hypothetical protein